MKFQDYQKFIPTGFPDTATVWIYQCDRELTDAETATVTQKLDQFMGQWNAHGSAVIGFGRVFFNRFIILMADEASVVVSGCSIDSTYRLLKSLEQELNVRLRERLSPAIIEDNEIHSYTLTTLKDAIKNGSLSGESLFFNNLVATKKEWLENWIVPLSQGWPWNKLKLQEHVSAS